MASKIALGIYSVVILLPPLIHGYIYPSIGDDAAYHIKAIEQINIGQSLPPGIIYLGQAIVGYPMVLLKQWVDINTMYLWFSYLSLIFVGLTFYYVLTKLVNQWAGIAGLLVPVFCFGAMLYQWYAGTIFNIINLAILMWGIYLSVKGLGKKLYFVVSALLFALAYIFHPSGGYIIAILPALIIAGSVKSDSIRILVILSITTLLLLASYQFKVSIDPYRQLLDAYNFLGLTVAVLAGMLIKKNNDTVMKIALVAFLCLFSLRTVIPWLVDYNSAIKLVDKQAIAYVLKLEGKYFSCSDKVAYWIYERYIDKEYQEGALPYIERTEPMTLQTTAGNKWYWWKNAVTYPIDNAVKFSDGSISIYVVN